MSAALAAVSFAVAARVRGETERVATTEEGVRAYYLAMGAVDRAILYMQWSQSANVGTAGVNPYFVNGQPRMEFQFPEGAASVEIIPEGSKLDLNSTKPEVLTQLMVVLGAAPDQAEAIAAAIQDWRRPASAPTGFDQINMSSQPSFRARHASFVDIEELLSLQGMTPDLFYGTWVRQDDGAGSHLAPRGGVMDCVSAWGSTERFDASTVQPAVLAAVGVPAGDIQTLIHMRAEQPILNREAVAMLAQTSPALASHLTTGYHSIFTLRATASLRRPDGSFSDMKRTVGALVKFERPGHEKTFRILRWYDRG